MTRLAFVFFLSGCLLRAGGVRALSLCWLGLGRRRSSGKSGAMRKSFVRGSSSPDDNKSLPFGWSTVLRWKFCCPPPRAVSPNQNNINNSNNNNNQSCSNGEFTLADQAKTVSSGYASFDYCTAPPEPADLVKVDIAINGDSVDALSFVCHRDAAQSKGRDVAKRLKEVSYE